MLKYIDSELLINRLMDFDLTGMTLVHVNIAILIYHLSDDKGMLIGLYFNSMRVFRSTEIKYTVIH